MSLVRRAFVPAVLTALIASALIAPLTVALDDPVHRGPTTNKTVALTFDDGYAADRCLEIADILIEFDIPATWFPNGVNVRASPKTWRSIAARFPIANHTLRHPNLVDMKPAEMRDELLTNQRVIERVTGQPMLPILRPTFGAYDKRVLRVAEELGYRVVLWDVSSADTSPNGTDRRIAQRALSGGPGSIILMHCGPEVTPRILPIVIARYACKGYRFATLDALLEGQPGKEARVECPPPSLPPAERRTEKPRDDGYPAAQAPPGLERYYEQALTWKGCRKGAGECATLDVPLDYADPDGDTVRLRIKRIPSTGDPARAIIVAPGGPGDPGREGVEAFAATAQDTLLPHADLIGFDARGVAGSAAISCLDTDGLDAWVAMAPGTDGDDAMSLGAACASEAVPLAEHMTTVETARDLDVMRAALSQEQLDYFGTAHGSYLGTTYAALFPERVGAMVLDGAMDPSLSMPQRRLGQAETLERRLRAFADACVSGGQCRLGSGQADVTDTIADLLEWLEAEPLPTADPGRPLTQALAFHGIVSNLVSADQWPSLTAALEAAIAADGGPLLLLADGALGRAPDGYTSNRLEAASVIDCLDTQLHDGAETASLDDFLARSPTFGASLHQLAGSCADWPLAPTVTLPDASAAGAAPILVLGATDDPVTPYEWAVALAETLEQGLLVTREGTGHAAFGNGNACVDEAVAAYYLEGVLPEDGMRC